MITLFASRWRFRSTRSRFVLSAWLGGGSVGALAEIWNELQKAAGGMGRIGELLDERSGSAAPAQPRSLPVPVRGELRFEGVTFHYPSRPDAPALEDFSQIGRALCRERVCPSV